MPESTLSPLAATLYRMQTFSPMSVLNSRKVYLCVPSLISVGDHEINAREVQTNAIQQPPRIAESQQLPMNSSGEEVRSLLVFFSPPQNVGSLFVSHTCFFLSSPKPQVWFFSQISTPPPPSPTTHLFLQNNLDEDPYILLFTSFPHWLYSHLCPWHSGPPPWFHRNKQHKQVPAANISGAFPQQPSPSSSYAEV